MRLIPWKCPRGRETLLDTEMYEILVLRKRTPRKSPFVSFLKSTYTGLYCYSKHISDVADNK
jgi:hypothetical protein